MGYPWACASALDGLQSCREGTAGRTLFEQSVLERIQRQQEQLQTLAQENARKGITVTFPKVFLDPDEPFECAGTVADNYFIFPNGRVYRCPLCEDYPLHSLELRDDRLIEAAKINEADLFPLLIPEGCVMNRIIQPRNLPSCEDGAPPYKVACCMLKEELSP